jgi:hypothetical protein
VVAGLCLAAAGWLACAGTGEPRANRTDSYSGAPKDVLSVAANLLERQGYEVSKPDETFLQLQGEKSEVTLRTEGSLQSGTVVTQQVIIDADAEVDRTRLNALFTVVWKRPTGERRVWVPESSISQRLLTDFYAALHRELGESGAAAE